MDASTDRGVARLLKILIGLVALLVVMLGAAGLFAYAEYSEVKGSLGKARGEDISNALTQLTQRQQTLAEQLRKDAELTRKEVDDLRRRRKELEEIPGGPMDKANQALRLSQLMSDQALLLLDHTVRFQEAVAKSVKPLEAQRQAREKQGR